MAIISLRALRKSSRALREKKGLIIPRKGAKKHEAEHGKPIRF